MVDIKVWDILVRIFHWSLVLFFSIAYISGGEDEWLSIHSYAGYTIIAIVLLRVLWGFVGTKYARFSNFVTGPQKALNYLKEEISGDAKRYLGHNPAGGLMVITLLISLVVTVISGMAIIATDGEGPLATTFIASFSGDWLEEIHEIFTTLILLLVLTHIAGVIFSSLLQEENLVKAMITGKKQVHKNDGSNE